MAAILLEPLLAPAATASACLGHGRHPIHTDYHIRPHGPFHSHAPTTSGPTIYAIAFDITAFPHAADKHHSCLPTAATTTTPYSITRNTTTEVLPAQPSSFGSTCTSSYSSKDLEANF